MFARTFDRAVACWAEFIQGNAQNRGDTLDIREGSHASPGHDPRYDVPRDARGVGELLLRESLAFHDAPDSHSELFIARFIVALLTCSRSTDGVIFFHGTPIDAL